MGKPWDGAIPAEDEAVFGSAAADGSSPMVAGERPALIVVDMTRAFVDSAYPTGFSPTGYPAVAANKRLLEVARDAAIPVFFTKSRPPSSPPPTAAEAGRWKRRRAAPAVDADLPPGDVIVEDLAPLEGEVVIDKQGRPSAFFGTQLASLLVYHRIDTTIVTGMVTSGCVRATVVDAFQLNYLVVVPHECCADRSQVSHKVSLFDMHMKYADVVDTAEVVTYLEKLHASQ